MHNILPVTSLIQIGNGVPQIRLREIDQSIAPFSQLPKRPCLMCAGNPTDLFVRGQQVVDDVGDAHVPRRDRAIDQRRVGAIAERIAVLQHALLVQRTRVLQIA